MTLDRRSSAITESIESLGWCVTIPHTIDQIIGIYAERIGTRTLPMRHGMTNDEILSALVSNGGGGGKGGHSDPTARAALWGEPDAVDDDETVSTIRAAVALCWESATELATICTITAPAPADPTLTTRIASTISLIHRWAPILEQTASNLEGDDLAHLDTLVRVHLTETAKWLHAKAEAIWLQHRGEALQPAVQAKIQPCACCSEWGCRDHAVVGSDLCAKCKGFQAEHKCLPTESIHRAWDYGRKRLTQSQLAEAKAAKRSTVKPRRVTA